MYQICKNDTINSSQLKSKYNQLFDIIMKVNSFCFEGFYKKYWTKYNNARNLDRKMDKLTKTIYTINMSIIRFIMCIPLIIIAPILCAFSGVSWIVFLLCALILYPFDLVKICKQLNNDYKKNVPFKRSETSLKFLSPIEYIFWVFLKHNYIYVALLTQQKLHIRLGLVLYFVPISVITGLVLLIELIIGLLLSIILSVPAVIESVNKVLKYIPFEAKRSTLKSLLPVIYVFWVFSRHKSIYTSLLKPKNSSMGYGIVLYVLPLSIITGLAFLIELVICLLLSVICSILAIFESITNIFRSFK